MSADGLSYIDSSDVEYRTDFLEVAGVAAAERGGGAPRANV